MYNFRFLCPVGQGGFDIEYIDGTTIVFDCGATHKCHFNNWVQHYKDFFEKHNMPLKINYVFLSHFDLDHVNGLNELYKIFTIDNIVVPYIPKRYRVLYNFINNFAVTRFHYSLSTSKFANTRLLGVNIQTKYQSIKSTNKKWEWIYKSLFSCSQWEILRSKLHEINLFDDNITYDDDEFFFNDGYDKSDATTWEQEVRMFEGSLNNDNEYNDQIIEPDSMSIDAFDIKSYTVHLTEEKIRRINDIIGEIINKSKKAYAKNENGLIMLSKRCKHTKNCNVFAIRYPNTYPFVFDFHYDGTLSACIYTGDMRFDLKSCPTILDFLKMTKEKLLLFQIPHHGSPHNTNVNVLYPILTNFFFLHDNNYNRINKVIQSNTQAIYQKLILIDTTFGFFCKIMI